MVELYEILDEIENNDTKISLKGLGAYIFKHDTQIKLLKSQIEELKKQRQRDETTLWQAISDIMAESGNTEKNLIHIIKQAIKKEMENKDTPIAGGK